LASFVSAFGFEPNPDEHRLIVEGRTRTPQPPYRRLLVTDYALSASGGCRTLYSTRIGGAASLLEPDMQTAGEIIAKGRMPGTTVPKRFQTSFAAHHLADAHRIEVKTTTLDAFAQEHGIEHVDLLKIDAQGSEYQVLEGAATTLATTGVVKVEVSFVPVYKGQKLFSHVDLLLREHGFDLLSYQIGCEQVIYRERTSAIEIVPRGDYPDPYAQPMQADAIYVNRTITDPGRSLAQSLVVIDANYLDEGLHILRTRAGIDDPVLSGLLLTVGTNNARGWLLRRKGYDLVDVTLDTVARTARLPRRLVHR
jgi:FkbM family methyltransferase